MHSRFVRRTTVPTLLALLTVLFEPALAAPHATLSGQVVSRDTNRPLEGARVHVASVRTGAEITALFVDSEGGFSVPGLAAEPVSLGIETGGTLFLSPTPVDLEPGMERTVTLAIPSPATLAPAKTDDEDDDRKGGWWTNPTTGALSVVFLPILIGGALKALDDDEEPVSPSPSEPEETR
jgi:hypothetical protein